MMIKMRKGYQYAITPTQQQAQKIEQNIGCARFIYNKLLEDKIKYYETNKKSIRLTPATYKSEYPFLKDADSMALTNAQINLETAFKKFSDEPKIGFPKFKCKHKCRASYTTNRVNNNIRITESDQNHRMYIKLPKLGEVKIKLHRLPQGSLKSVTVFRQADKYYVSILFEEEIEISKCPIIQGIGLDYSQKELYVDSEGNHCGYPHYYRVSERKLARENRKLSKMKKGSNNYIKQKAKIAKLHLHIANQRKDFLHKESRKIANSYDYVAVEDIDMKALSQALHLAKNLLDNGFGMFRKMLEYKLEEQGKVLVKVDKWYASTQICHQCGSKQKMELKERQYICPKCGYEADRDENAAKNLREEGKRILESI